MGTIAHLATGRRRTLAARTLVGRSERCLLRLDSGRVSAEHAVIFYEDESWKVRDLGSTNGTWLAGEQLRPGDKQELRDACVLAFGEPQAAMSWCLVDHAPPEPRARCIGTGRVELGVGNMLMFPADEGPSTTVYFDSVSGDWMCETDLGSGSVEDQQVIQVGPDSYLLELPPLLQATTATRRSDVVAESLRGAQLRFAVSMDEEHVQLSVAVGTRLVELPPRAFHYLLLLLARQRLTDAELPASEQGWVLVEQLMDQLKASRQKLNLDVSRARRQLAEAGIEDAVTLIERRPQASQLRIGVEDLVVRAP